MEQEANTKIDRHPGQIEQRSRPAPGQEAANLVKIPQWLLAVTIAARLERQAHDCIEHTKPEPLIEVTPDPNADPASDKIETALEEIKHHRQHQQRDERRNAATGQHPVIDLKHEERAGEHQEIAQAAEDGKAPEYPTARSQECRNLGLRLIVEIRRAGGAGKEPRSYKLNRALPPPPTRATMIAPALPKARGRR